MPPQLNYDALFKQTLLIRRVEEKIVSVYSSDLIQSPVHLSIGQEAVAVGLCDALDESDLIFGTYRSHAMYLACGGDLEKMFAEMMGRIGGVSKGKAGSMHLTFPDSGLMGTSAVVSSHIPHAVGSALASKHRHESKVILCIFGDGALEEGVAHEAFNFAALKKLPVLFVCEDNDLAVHSLRKSRQSFSIENLARLYGMQYHLEKDGFDFAKVAAVGHKCVNSIRKGGGPHFLEIKTFRAHEHVGPGKDFEFGYRGHEQSDEWFAKDPLVVDTERYNAFLPEVDALIEACYQRAMRSPVPGSDELLTDVL